MKYEVLKNTSCMGKIFRKGQVLEVDAGIAKTLGTRSLKRVDAPEAPVAEGTGEGSKDLSKLKRAKLDAKALELGCTQDDIDACENKAEVIDLIEAAEEDAE